MSMEKLRAINELPYKEQAIWFLNAFWSSSPSFSENLDEAENVWIYKGKCVELDRKGEDGHELDEFQAHRLLEMIGSTLSVKDMREKLSEVDIDFNRYVSLTEFLIHKYGVDWKTLVDAPQGEMDEGKLKEAEKLMAECTVAMEDCSAKAAKAKEDERLAKVSEAKSLVAEHDAKEAEEAAIATEKAATVAANNASAAEAAAIEMEKQAKGAEKDAIHAEMDAKSAESAAETAEAEAKTSESAAFVKETEARSAEEAAVKAEDHAKDVEAQVAQALAELQREEDTFNSKKAQLKATSEDDSLGIVKRNTAKNELAQLEQTDPLPLQRAKINQEAVLRRQQKATKSSAAKRAAASSARSAAEASRIEAVSSREEAEATRIRAAGRREEAVRTRVAAEESRKKAEESRAEAEKSRVEAEEAKEAASASREAATSQREAAEAAAAAAKVAREAAENAVVEADAAVTASVEAYKKAEEFMQQVKKDVSAAGKGKLWWLDRELTEAKKYMSAKQLAKLAAMQGN